VLKLGSWFQFWCSVRSSARADRWPVTHGRTCRLERKSSCAALHGLQQRADLAAVAYSTMANSSVATTFTGHRNEGLQIGYNSGFIHVAAPSECSPATGTTDVALTNPASPRRTTRDSTTTLLLRAVPPRCRLCRPRHAARSDPRAMRSASIAGSAGWPRWSRVS
jgi:hypothetical protein